MAAWPAVLVTALSLWFFALLVRQWGRRRRASLGFWAASLLFSAVASAGYCATLWTQPHAAWSFLIYYIFGAMWMPSLMGLGSVGLLGSKWLTWISAGLVLVVGGFGTGMLLVAPLQHSALDSLAGGAGTGVIRNSPAWLVPLIVLNSFGAISVIGVALQTVWRRLRQAVRGRFLSGNLLLAGGILVISAAGSAARLGWPGLFWITMLVGWIITFIGYRLLTPLV